MYKIIKKLDKRKKYLRKIKEDTMSARYQKIISLNQADYNRLIKILKAKYISIVDIFRLGMTKAEKLKG